jgi:hypothetical protein
MRWRQHPEAKIMSNIMAVLLNGLAQLEFDREKPLPDYQTLYLDKMDARMDEGIRIGEASIVNPDRKQRAQFVAANLLHAIRNNDEPLASALCSYLAVRLPELKQVRIEEDRQDVSIELVFDEDYRKQVAVPFVHLH